jgi:tetratricopeptide (TPR) repeat protein
MSVALLHAQQTRVYVADDVAYRKGIELFDNQNYLSARQKFEEIYKAAKSEVHHTNETLMQNLEYYIAVSACETNDNDAELLLLNYNRNYHETDKRRLINFYLGKLYYRKSKYTEALEFLTKVDTKDLTNTQLYEWRFQTGYCYFVKKKFAEAKPLFLGIKDINDKYFYPANYYYAFICFYTKDYNEALKSFAKVEDSKTYNKVIPYYIAQIHYMRHDYATAATYITKSLEKTDILYKDEMRYLLGQVYFQQSEYTKALPYLENYTAKVGKQTKESIYMLAYCQYKTANYTKAIENFKQLNLLEDKVGQNATYALADCYLQTKQKEKARVAFQSAASYNYDIAIKENSLFNYAKLSLEAAYATDAVAALEDYLLSFPNGVFIDEANELLAISLMQTKNYDKAYKIIESLKTLNPALKEAYQKVTYLRAVENFNDGKPDAALSMCDKSLLYPINRDFIALATYLKAEVFYGKEDYENAKQLYLKFAELSTKLLESKNDASKFRAYYNVGYCYFKKKNYKDAATYFKRALDESDETADAKGKFSLLPDLYQRYADCSFVTKDYKNALSAYSHIADGKWNNAEYALYQKGIVLGLMGRNQEKITALTLLISKYPGSNFADNAYYEIGETQMDENNNTEAQRAYQNVISKFTSSEFVPRSYLKLAVINYRLGKREEAISNYKSVVKNYGNTQEAKEAVEALKEIYVESGRADEFFNFARETGSISISASEQDSLTYQAALNAYNSNDCNRAITLFAGYISKFGNGFFVNEARWRKSDCHIKAKDFTAALETFEGIIETRYSTYYEKSLLKASGICFYELKNYDRALKYYRMLFTVATSPQNTYSSLIGMMRSAVALKKSDESIEYADQLINSNIAKDADLQEAYFVKGKAWYAIGEKESAMGAFNRVTEMPVSEKAVEAKYMVAKILFEQADYKNSVDTCFRIKNKYGSYEYWIVKTFILLADNYSAQGNAFQAKATLESIANNYEGDQALLNEAKEKLRILREQELGKSRIADPIIQDTLILEDPSTQYKW